MNAPPKTEMPEASVRVSAGVSFVSLARSITQSGSASNSRPFMKQRVNMLMRLLRRPGVARSRINLW